MQTNKNAFILFCFWNSFKSISENFENYSMCSERLPTASLIEQQLVSQDSLH